MKGVTRIWLAGALPALAIHALGSPGGVALRAGVEALLLLGGMILLARRLAPLAADLPRAARVVLPAAIALQLFAQVLDRNLLTYPFVQWGMYGSAPSHDVVVRVPVGVSAAGERVEIRPSSAFPPLDAQRLSFRIADLADDPALAPCLDEVLVALGRSGDFTAVELVERRFDARAWEESEGAVVRRVEVPR